MSGFLKVLFSLAVIFAIAVISINIVLKTKDQLADICPNYKTGSCSKQFDAVVAISGGNTNTRTNNAIAIFNSVSAKKLIFSGAAADPNSPSNAESMRALAVQNGVAPHKILLEERANNTQENAKYTAEIIKANGFSRVILTTSPYHQRRAQLEFEKALRLTNVQVISAPASEDPDWSNFWWLSSRGWYLALSEVMGIIRFYVGAS